MPAWRLGWVGCHPHAPEAVNEILWTALGAAAGAAAALAIGRARRAPAPAAQEIETNVAPKTRELALSMAEELASLVSAVEARAHHLIEAAPTRTDLPRAAEAMLTSVDRLQNLHKKLVAAGGGRPVEAGVTDVCELIGSLGEELQQLQLGLEIRWDPPPELPGIDAHQDALRDAMLFVCAALLRAERGATRLTFSTERSFSRERPTIKLELNLEWITARPGRREDTSLDGGFALDWEAAKQLVQSHGGELTLSHLPGKAVHAVVRFPVAEPEPEPDAARAQRPAPADPSGSGPVDHAFGGALVLESDPALRAVLARELKATGRAVFVCSDGEAAHTFLEATPDRFELLILDDPQALQPRTPLARTIRAHAPALKICLLTPTPSRDAPTWDGMRTLEKPFGVHELRRTLANILAEA